MLVVDNLTIKYKNNLVLHNLSLQINIPGIYGLCAPNGSGKTTLLRAIGGMDLRAFNKVYILPYAHSTQRIYPNHKVKYHKHLFYFENEGMLFPQLSALDHLKLISNVYNTHNIYQNVIQELNMGHFINKKIKTLSLGMKQLLIIAMAFSSQANYVILDEPSNGLDFLNSMQVNNLMKTYTKKDHLILYSSHKLDQLSNNTKEIFLLYEGKLRSFDAANNELANEFLKLYSINGN